MKTTTRAEESKPFEALALILDEWLIWSRVPCKNFAIELGVCEAIISHWRAGDRFPSVRNLRKLTRATGICACCFVCEACARKSIATRHGWRSPE